MRFPRTRKGHTPNDITAFQYLLIVPQAVTQAIVQDTLRTFQSCFNPLLQMVRKLQQTLSHLGNLTKDMTVMYQRKAG